MGVRKKKVRKPLKLTAEALTEDTYSGGGRKTLFLKAAAGEAYKFRLRVVPAMSKRGPKGVDVPYFLGMQHWYPIVKDDGTAMKSGVACVDFMRRQHPFLIPKWEAEGVDAITQDAGCLTCEILRQEEVKDENDESTWPRLVEYFQFGKPSMYWSTSYSFAVIDRDQTTDSSDPHVIKIFPANKTIKEAIINLADPDGPYPFFLDEEEGNDIHVKRYGGKPWKFSVTPFEASPIDLDDWEDLCPDLDSVCPNWWTREEQEEWWRTHLPEVLTSSPMTGTTTSVPKKKITKKKAVKLVKSKKA